MKVKYRRLLKIGLSAVVLLVSGAMAFYYVYDKRYQRLLNRGSDLDSFFSTYSKDFKAMSQSLLLSSYDDSGEINFFVKLDSPINIDGAKKMVYIRSDARPSVSEQVKNYFDQVAKIDNAKFKLNRLYDFSKDSSVSIRVRFQVWGALKSGEGFYDSGLLTMSLRKGYDATWEITSQDIENAYRISKPSETYFADVTTESGLDLKLGSIKELDDRFAEHKFGVFARLGRGMAVSDVNRDGYPDIFLSGVHRAALYINDGKGHFRDAAAEWGLTPELSSFSTFPLVVDFDNDGDVDLLLLRLFDGSRLLRNEGKRFKDVTSDCGLEISPHAMTACAADYDGDGNIDLFIGSYGNTKDDVPETVVRSRNGQPAHLYRDHGDWKFEDVSERAGIHATGWSLVCTFYDLTGDGKPDIYIGNDFGYNSFYGNNGDGTFTDKTWDTGTHDIGSAMNVSLLDYDGDGNLDIYTSGIASNTVWFQGPGMNYILSRFLTTPATFNQTLSTFIDLGMHAPWSELNELGYKVNNGNSLMQNVGADRYAHKENESECAWAEWAWGATAEDFDCDGNTDIYVANGFITSPDTKDF